MANQSNLHLHRSCRECKAAIYGTARALREHAKLCGMATRLGLVLPGIVTPDEASRQARVMREMRGGARGGGRRYGMGGGR